MSTRGPKDIQTEVNDARSHLDRTLDAIEGRFTPGQAIDRVFRYIRGGTGGFAGNFGNTVQNNPIPVTLLGVGLIWLMVADARPEPTPSRDGSSTRGALDKAKDKARGVGDQAKGIGDKAKGAGDTAKGNMRNARERAGHAAGVARDRVGQMGESGRYQAQRARDNASHLLREHPLAIGALGIALGAVVAASLPATRKEDAAMGQLRDDSVRKAEDTGRDYAERAKPVAEAAQTAAAQESDKQGLKAGKGEKQPGSNPV
jgi:ElaB/YqjD/DUF883 family membrane-anchored ribosome-binding protein